MLHLAVTLFPSSYFDPRRNLMIFPYFPVPLVRHSCGLFYVHIFQLSL